MTMEIAWYGTAALLLREGDAAIAFDPFCGMPLDSSLGQAGLRTLGAELRGVREVFITHGHFDHILHIPQIYKDAPLCLRCTKTPRETLVRKGVAADRIREIRPGAEEIVGPFTVTAYQGRHCKFDLPLIFNTVFRWSVFQNMPRVLYLAQALLRYPENGEILFYEVLCGGMRVQIMGSLGLAAGVDYPTGADLLILPFQGRSDLDIYGLGLVRRLRPKAVLLDHWDDAFPPLSDTVKTESFEKILREWEGIPCRTMVKGVRNEYGEAKETLG